MTVLLTMATAAMSQSAPSTPIDPLAISVDRRDADRFAELMRETGDRPTAEQLQARYLDGGGQGIAVFTPDRIENAGNLARAIGADPARYRYAIDTCLPIVDSLHAEMRSVYLAYRGLLPDFALPSAHVVFGAGNSGGTASRAAQVIGLEVVCGPGTTPDQFRQTMRTMFAHETVHSWQGDEENAAAAADLLLYVSLREGTADYLASLVTGSIPSAARNEWAVAREGALWREFGRDRSRVQAGTTGVIGGQTRLNDDGRAAIMRWVANYGSAPDGWPIEAGYWVGMRIAQTYVERSPDRAAAIRTLIILEDPAAILAASGYAPGM
jgi:hypothetical protein